MMSVTIPEAAIKQLSAVESIAKMKALTPLIQLVTR
jgi:hypothetical protein